MATARDFIKIALQDLGVLADGEVPTASQANDALGKLNRMLQSWCARTLLTTMRIGESFPLVAFQNAYDIGPTYGTPPIVSDFTTSKPFTIIGAVIIDATFNMTPVEIVSVEEIISISMNLTTFGRPTRIVYDPGPTQQVGQVGTIYVFPIPDAIYTLGIESEKPFTSIPALDTVITFPLHYERAIISNLAIELYPQYPRAQGIDPILMKIANDSMDIIETLNSNTKKTIMDTGLPLPGSANILQGS